MGRVTTRIASKLDPFGRTPLPAGPFVQVMPVVKRDAGVLDVCTGNAPYDVQPPSQTTCKVFVAGLECTAWFIADNAMALAGHCITDENTGAIAVDPANPGSVCCNMPEAPEQACPNNALWNIEVCWC